MTTNVIEQNGQLYRRESGLRRWARGLRNNAGSRGAAALATTARTVIAVAKAKAIPSAIHVREHAYSIMGFACFDGAMFYHSVFSGLLVTGLSWFVYEWKVADDDVTPER